jgi:predicted AAA+ superfamily ATPase
MASPSLIKERSLNWVGGKMDSISDVDIRRRLSRDNPWWQDREYHLPEASSPKRVYFSSFKELSLNFDVRRATVLLGPRRVGKTFMIKQLIHDAINGGISRQNLLYVSIDAPIYSGISLEKFLSFMPEGSETSRCLVIFDEIQYLQNWEINLKDLVDNYPNVKFVWPEPVKPAH